MFVNDKIGNSFSLLVCAIEQIFIISSLFVFRVNKGIDGV